MGAVRAGFIRTLAGGLSRAGLLKPISIAAAYARRSPAFLVLKYHRVNDDGDPFFPALAPTLFERQMALIARTYLVLPVEELVERMTRGSLPRRALAITFDDGYRDNLTHAAPILARYGLPATIFITSGFVGGGEVPWFDRVALTFKATRASEYLTPWGTTVTLNTPGERLVAVDRMLAYLKNLPDDERRRAVDRLQTGLGDGEQDRLKGWMLSWDDVHALAGLGFSVGAHTVSHPILSRVSRERARAEIEGSRSKIAAASGRTPRAFAYPNGGADDYSEMVSALVREAGFTCAVTTRFGVNTRETPLYELRRGGPWEQELSTFALKLAVYRLTQA